MLAALELIAELMPMTSPRALISGPPAVAKIDRRIGLNIAVERPIEQLSPDEAHHADRDRVLVGERIADSEHPLPHPQRIRVAKRRMRNG